MAFTYNIQPSGGDRHDTAPFWFAAIVRFKWRDVFSRAKMANSPQSSSVLFPVDAMAEKTDVLILDNISAWNVTTSKSSHVSSCSFVVANADYNLLSEVASGDWMGFWSFDNRADYVRVLDLVKKRGRCNGFMDGLKFIGRIDAARRRRSKAPNGQKSIVYNLTGQGFGELDSVVYYDPIFIAKYKANALQWMVDMGKGPDNLLAGARRAGTAMLTSQVIVPRLLRICLGVQSATTSQSPASGLPGKGTNKNAALAGALNKAYLIPNTVGSWLGVVGTAAAKSHLSYSDIVRLYIGVQTYSSYTYASDDVSPVTRTTKDAFNGFHPELKPLDVNTYETLTNLSGEFLFLPITQRTTVWTLINTYINSPVDEMYSCLRVDPSGYVMPTLIARQNPMSTYWAQQNMPDVPLTPFMDLPRWKIDSSLLVDEDIGRSNQLRYNAVRFLGHDMVSTHPSSNNTVRAAIFPPIIDNADVSRSGLRMAEGQLSSMVNIVNHSLGTQPGAKWQKLMADILMGGHLKYSGTLAFKGIQEPICEGDNIEWENAVYHIEQVTHSGAVQQQTGIRDFTTTLQVSNGIDLSNGSYEINYGTSPATATGSRPDGSSVEIVYPEFELDEGTIEKEAIKSQATEIDTQPILDDGE